MQLHSVTDKVCIIMNLPPLKSELREAAAIGLFLVEGGDIPALSFCNFYYIFIL